MVYHNFNPTLLSPIQTRSLTPNILKPLTLQLPSAPTSLLTQPQIYHSLVYQPSTWIPWNLAEITHCEFLNLYQCKPKEITKTTTKSPRNRIKFTKLNQDYPFNTTKCWNFLLTMIIFKLSHLRRLRLPSFRMIVGACDCYRTLAFGDA